MECLFRCCNTGGTGYGQAEDYTLSVTSVTACLTGVLHPSELYQFRHVMGLLKFNSF
jgi:hypothetical protein